MPDILGRTNLARLACARGGQPYIVPISFAFDPESDSLFGFSTIGRKVEWMRENPNVCVEVEDVEDRFHWTTLGIFGSTQEVSDSPVDRAMRQRALDLFEGHAEWWLPGAARVGPREHPDVVIYRIQITTMTGRRAARDRT